MDIQKRAPSVDMASVELKDMPSPAPAYGSTFISHDVLSTPQHATPAETSHSGISNNPYHQSTIYDLPSSILHLNTGASSKDADEACVKPDYQDTNHPHFTRSSGPGFPTILPTRSRMARNCILVPWVLFAIFFLTTIWYTSILLGARFFSIIHPASSAPTVQEIHFYINGQVLQGSAPVSNRTVALPTSTVTSTTNPPSQTAPLPDTLPDMSKGMDGLSASSKRRTAPAPTGLTTITRRGP